MSITISFAQISVQKDYLRKGSRIIEIEYDGTAYSLVLDAINQEREAKLIFKNLVRNKSLEVKLNENSANVFEIYLGNKRLVSSQRVKDRITFVNHENEYSNDDIKDITAFSKVMEKINPDWPLEGDDTGDIQGLTWRILNISFGGTRSITEARCNKVFNNEITGTGCRGTTDCDCLKGNFLCWCICGEICEF